MTKEYVPLAAANEFIKLAQPGGIDHMKLQKLVYLALGHWLAKHEESFLMSNPQVWQYGPVFADMYHELKHLKRDLIHEPQKIFDKAPEIDDSEIKDVIKNVWQQYGDKSGVYLSDLTHKPGSPWHRVAKQHDYRVPLGTTISTEDIKSYYREQAEIQAKAVA